MSKKRLFMAAKELAVSNDHLIKTLKSMGFSVKSHMSILTPDMVSALDKKFQKERVVHKKKPRKKEVAPVTVPQTDAGIPDASETPTAVKDSKPTTAAAIAGSEVVSSEVEEDTVKDAVELSPVGKAVETEHAAKILKSAPDVKTKPQVPELDTAKTGKAEVKAKAPTKAEPEGRAIPEKSVIKKKNHQTRRDQKVGARSTRI